MLVINVKKLVFQVKMFQFLAEIITALVMLMISVAWNEMDRVKQLEEKESSDWLLLCSGCSDFDDLQLENVPKPGQLSMSE